MRLQDEKACTTLKSGKNPVKSRVCGTSRMWVVRTISCHLLPNPHSNRIQHFLLKRMKEHCWVFRLRIEAIFPLRGRYSILQIPVLLFAFPSILLSADEQLKLPFPYVPILRFLFRGQNAPAAQKALILREFPLYKRTPKYTKNKNSNTKNARDKPPMTVRIGISA